MASDWLVAALPVNQVSGLKIFLNYNMDFNTEISE